MNPGPIARACPADWHRALFDHLGLTVEVLGRAFAVDSRIEVERLHAIAVDDAGWTTVSDPTVFTPFSDRLNTSFLEDDNGVRIAFVHNPPRESVES